MLDDRDAWRLHVDGVERPGSLSLAELKNLGLATEAVTIQCSGNGRAFFAHGPSGSPWATGAAGCALWTGVRLRDVLALSGERGVAQVEVSLDGGQTWSLASFEGPDLGPNAWRTFSFSTELAVGNHTLYTRATDTTGDVQPRDRAENERGYGHNGWWDHGLSVTVTAQAGETEPVEPRAQPATTPQDTAPRTLSPAGERGKQVFVEGAAPPCGTCHTLADADAVGAIGPSLDTLAPDAARVESAVTSGVGAMPAYGGRLTESEIRDVATYVAEATRR